jgi:hypothetical protein
MRGIDQITVNFPSGMNTGVYYLGKQTRRVRNKTGKSLLRIKEPWQYYPGCKFIKMPGFTW